MEDWLARCSVLLAQRSGQALLRERTVVQPLDGTHIQIDGVRYVNFSANNYLGLTHHPKLVAAMQRSGSSAGSGAAGLVSGFSQQHAAAEAALAAWKGTQAAVLLPSGYQANLAAVQTVAAIGAEYPAGVRFILDKLAHASLIDAVRATGSPMRIFPHNNLIKLRRLIESADPQQLQVVLTESIFSMDGDAADLRALAQLKGDRPFVLILDEAHASGVYGIGGAGLAAETQLQHIVDVSIVTLSKAMGCIGGAVCSSAVFRDALLNFGRAYIYSTSVPPIVAACAQAAVEIMRDEPQRQKRVRSLATKVRAELTAAGRRIPPGDSPIIPIVLGSEEAALRASEQLRRERLLVVAVRPPTVPVGSSRLRITLSSEHTDEEIQHLLNCLAALRSAASLK